jgi:hypothetical protein
VEGGVGGGVWKLPQYIKLVNIPVWPRVGGEHTLPPLRVQSGPIWANSALASIHMTLPKLRLLTLALAIW